MGLFSESYTKIVVIPTLWQRIKFLFCLNCQVTAQSGDCHESVEFTFNVK